MKAPGLNSPGLNSLGVISVDGPDARSFLQGQLSGDLNELAANRALLASLNSAQGRVQAILTLIAHGDAVLLLLPAELVEFTLARLKPYVLRSKVVLGDASAAWQLDATTGVQRDAGSVSTSGAALVLKWWSKDERSLSLQPAAIASSAAAAAVAAAAAAALTEQSTTADDQWHRANIATGIPQLNLATREHFVAQMLNLDLLGGISFKKGCYTGQEIIARTQYRGAIKRRLFRFQVAAPPPAAGTKLLHGETTAGEVLDAVATADGAELLAVVSLAELAGELRLADGSGPLLQLPLPYEIPLPASD